MKKIVIREDEKVSPHIVEENDTTDISETKQVRKTKKTEPSDSKEKYINNPGIGKRKTKSAKYDLYEKC